MQNKLRMKKQSFIYNTTLLVFLLSAVISGHNRAYAHCDTLDGPVIKDARTALERGDVTPVLKWIKKESEPEIRAAFNSALAEKSRGKETREKADMKFFETLVRVHRTGEGASFEGLKPAGEVEPIIKSADEAIEKGSIGALNKKITVGVEKRFNRVMATIKHKEESVDAGREYVEAYVDFMHYVEKLYDVASKYTGHHKHTTFPSHQR